MTEKLEKHYKQPTAVIDIDGVVAGGTRETVYSDYAGWCFEKCYPIEKGITLVKELKSRGIKIKFNTARPEASREVTVEWLRKHDVPYDELFMDKPSGHIYIDDRGYYFGEDSFTDDFWFNRHIEIIVDLIKKWVVR